MDKWHPIETAPKTGQPILVSDGTRIHVARWDDDRHCKKPKPFWKLDTPLGIMWHRQNQPTKWMFLPPP